MVSPRPLTARQLELLRWLDSFIATHGFAPTLREIGSALGIESKNGVADHLRLMEAKGVVTRAHAGRHGGARARTLRITDAGRAALVAAPTEAA